jgi:hypothetical protein
MLENMLEVSEESILFMSFFGFISNHLWVFWWSLWVLLGISNPIS